MTALFHAIVCAVIATAPLTAAEAREITQRALADETGIKAALVLIDRRIRFTAQQGFSRLSVHASEPGLAGLSEGDFRRIGANLIRRGFFVTMDGGQSPSLFISWQDQ